MRCQILSVIKMNKSLKFKIFVSFLLLILMLLIAGIMSILEFRKLGDSVETVMKNNYQSIEKAKEMIDAVEREESGLLLYMLSDTIKAEETIESAHSVMLNAIEGARLNITENNEKEHIEKIELLYSDFHRCVQKIASPENTLQENKNIYLNELNLLFGSTKNAINDLMTLNQDKLYAQSTNMRENSERAMMPGIISVMAAALFAILLNIFISIYFINPIQKLINEVKSFYPEKGKIDAKIVFDDEIKTLENEINTLIRRLSQRTQM